MQTLLRYFRALLKTFYVLLRGGKLPEEAHMAYRRWAERTVALIATVLNTATQYGLIQSQREALKVKVDGRETSLETILQAIRYHAQEEYLYLLQHITDKSLTTIHATNLNDTYAIDKFLTTELITDPTIRGTLVTLHAHLQQIPNKN